MVLPCEIAIWNTLPRIRADIARQMVKNGVKQKEIADKLSLTPAAVSQYIHKKRGGNIKSTPQYKKMILNASKKISKSNTEEEINSIICKCCMKARD